MQFAFTAMLCLLGVFGAGFWIMSVICPYAVNWTFYGHVAALKINKTKKGPDATTEDPNAARVSFEVLLREG